MASGSKDAGLLQIIDLRADYKSDAYRKRCEEFGISYYRYPVVRGGKLENDYVSTGCSMQQIRALLPHPFEGREDKGLDTHKITRALNGMYEYMAHRDGKEPMPIETFRKRKEIIKELSRKSD